MDSSLPWIALAASIVIPLITFLINQAGLNRKASQDEANQLRDDLSAEAKMSRGESVQLQVELSEWRDKYYNVREKQIARDVELEQLRAEFRNLQANCQAELKRLNGVVRELLDGVRANTAKLEELNVTPPYTPPATRELGLKPGSE